MMNRFIHFTALHASYLKRVFDIMPAPGQSASLCLIPQADNTPEVVQYACDLVDYFIGKQSVIKFVYGSQKNDWYLACRNQNAQTKLNNLIDLMLYNTHKKEILIRLNSQFKGTVLKEKNGQTHVCFIPILTDSSKNLTKTQQQLALYFGWKKDKNNLFWSLRPGLSARLIYDMNQQNKQTALHLKKSHVQANNR